MITKNFNSYANLAMFFIVPVLFCFVFEHETLHAKRVLAVFDFYYHNYAYNQTERENLES